MTKIGIIGGSGLDDPKILKNAKEIKVKTPYGEPSSPLTAGRIGNAEVVMLARHGRRHTVPPTQVNYRANLSALKQQGCTHVLATTACGSLREKIRRGDFVVLDQFIDFSRRRQLSFYEKFEPGIENSKHTPMADPFDGFLRAQMIAAAGALKLRCHPRGTLVTIEGPRFSTRAESNMFRSWGADVINMTVATEAALARELELPYAAVAVSTDYDCWKTDEEPVTMADILRVFAQNVENLKKLLLKTIALIGVEK